MKKPMQRYRFTFSQELRDYITIVLGIICYTSGFSLFQLPHQITTGGVMGAGAVIYYCTGFPAQFTYLAVNLFLLILAVRILGWKFCIKTIFAVGCMTLLLSLDSYLMTTYAAELANEMSAQGLPILVSDRFMSCLLGAACEGIGLGFIFLSNGSTGGTDIISSIVNKYRDITLGQMMMFCDFVIITCSLIVPADNNAYRIESLLYGYCTLVVANLMLDFIVNSGRQSVQFLIFSSAYDDIAAAIAATGRGVTVLEGQGWYTKTERKVLVVLAKKRECTNIFRIIKNIDPKAFVSQSKVVGVFGEGFDQIKVKTQPAKKGDEKKQ